MGQMETMDNKYNNKSESNSGDGISLKFYVGVFRKYKLPILLITSLVTGLAGFYAFTATPIYYAKSTLLISDQSNSLVRFEELVGVDTESQDYYTTQYELLRSRGLAVRVMEQLDLWRNPEFHGKKESSSEEESDLGGMFSDSWAAVNLSSTVQSFKYLVGLSDKPTEEQEVASSAASSDIERTPENLTEATVTVSTNLDDIPQLTVTPSVFGTTDIRLDQERHNAVSNFMDLLSIKPISSTKLVEIGFKSTDPDLAAQVANATGEQYIASFIEAKVALTERASAFLNERLSFLKQTLDESEGRLQRFKEENELVDVDGSVGRLNEQVLMLVSAELAEARSDLTAKSNLYREVRKLSGDPDLLENLPAVQSDPLLQRVKIEKGRVEQLLNELQNRYGNKHPRIIDALSQLETINLALGDHIDRVVSSITSDYNLARQRVASIEQKLGIGKQDVQAIGTKKVELNELEREVATNRKIYDTFFSQIAEARSSDGLDAANASVSDVALSPLKPISPRKPLIIGLAALMSLLVSFAVAALLEQLNDTVKSTNDVEHKLGVKLLGILPLVRNGRLYRQQKLPLSPVKLAEQKGAFAEAVNTVRTALSLNCSDCKVMMITSSLPGEGKSTAAINLAYSMGRQERVLLIDCDLRRPTVAKAAGLPRDTHGLSSLITKTAPAKHCIQEGVFGGIIDVIPSGPATDGPLELLSSQRFGNILKQLTRHYDRVILDCAPTQAVSDALILSKFSDAVIYVIKSRAIPMNLAQRGLERLQQVNAPIAGVIITQVDTSKLATYGTDYEYDGYYGYYGDDEYVDKLERGGAYISLNQHDLKQIRQDVSMPDLNAEVRTKATGRSGVKSFVDDGKEVINDHDLTERVAVYPERSVPQQPPRVRQQPPRVPQQPQRDRTQSSQTQVAPAPKNDRYNESELEIL